MKPAISSEHAEPFGDVVFCCNLYVRWGAAEANRHGRQSGWTLSVPVLGSDPFSLINMMMAPAPLSNNLWF